MRLELGTMVTCIDVPYGELADVVIDPTTNRVTHLVVEPQHEPWVAQLVPVTLARLKGFKTLFTAEKWLVSGQIVVLKPLRVLLVRREQDGERSRLLARPWQRHRRVQFRDRRSRWLDGNAAFLSARRRTFPVVTST
jgi:hypothetical protein